MNQGFEKSIKISSSKEFIFNFEDSKFTVITDNALEFPTVPDTQRIQDDTLNQHFHMYYELFYVSDGEIKIDFENEIKTLKRGSLLIISPNIMHRVAESGKGKRYNINFLIENNHIESDLPIYQIISKALSHDYLFLENSDDLYEPLKKLCVYVNDEKKLEIGLQFHDFIKAFFKLVYPQPEPKKSQSLTRDSEITRKYKLHSIIHNNYKNDISLDDVATALSLSVRQTNRIIKSNYGCNFRELIAKLRMQQAAKLLTKSDMTVSDIAQTVGYNSICGFYNAFSKEYKKTPSEYRRGR